MKIGIVVFPGTTCEWDTYKWCVDNNHVPIFLSHQCNEKPRVDFIIVPGGFAFGDREYRSATGNYSINPGVQALKTPVMDVIRECVGSIPILGICNGFQILTHANILPGKLLQNQNEKFYCDNAHCYISENSILSKSEDMANIPVAHGYGNYQISTVYLNELHQNNQIFLTYELPFNGSIHNIAGICNYTRTVWGMMPHPERSPYAKTFMRAIENYVRNNF
jgi:phosphoribosylformylglycinamidine synthase subunit PurQ / glutaminase